MNNNEQQQPKNSLANMKKFLLLGVIAIIGIGTVAAVWLARQQTDQRTKAAPSTTISFITGSQKVGVGQTLSADLQLDPGQNQVSIVKLVVTYESAYFDKDTALLTPNLVTGGGLETQGFNQILQPFSNTCEGNLCKMSVTMSIGSSPTSVVTQPVKIASLSLKALAKTSTADTKISIDSSSAAYSLSSADETNENVISFSSLVPLAVTIDEGVVTTPSPSVSISVNPTNAPVCENTQTTCAWDPFEGAASYHYKITRTDTGAVVKEGDTTQISVEFPSTVGIPYTCSVSIINVCDARGKETTLTNTCSLSPTPTPTGVTPTPTDTPTPTPTPTDTPTPTISPTPTNTPTPTPTPMIVACNNSCGLTKTCQGGLSCINGVCRNPSCSSQSSCECPAPTTIVTQPPQTVIATQPPKVVKLPPPTGPGEIFLTLGVIGGIIAIAGLAIFTGL